MSDEYDWDFVDDDDAKVTLRAAVQYLLGGAVGSDRDGIVREIIEIVSEVARSAPSGLPDPFDDAPGG